MGLLSRQAELHRYRFSTRWELPAAYQRVFEVLADPLVYPRWWPQILEVQQLTDDSGRMRFRSLLPYELQVTAFAARHDPDAGVLEARLTGDLAGVTRWTVSRDGGGRTVAVFDEDVEVHKPLMRLLALPGRPAFRANHAWMMRAGRAGLARHLGLRHWS
ncbi:polyketide cyclase [Streptacidiphilus pinicola]|uniref:Polyketide cyclase n=1 Tax=Streptacidiphilus pinicola TaxID=2219663 RepID=A0A2X0ID86_9ACTN|nr:SRPBCC family protein [Streptacidiphilus pinicola]RAG82962.1 polyketide cyclase [Streptacidiphilus pinicola]